jgi:hypothetical protein
MDQALPDKPSELIRVALQDLELAEKSPNIRVNMFTFFAYNLRQLPGECVMCLAGSVMYFGSSELRGSLKESAGEMAYWPNRFDKDTADKLSFLSDFQFGLFSSSFCYLGLDWPESLPGSQKEFPQYRYEPQRYKAELRRLADQLEELGL